VLLISAALAIIARFKVVSRSAAEWQAIARFLGRKCPERP